MFLALVGLAAGIWAGLARIGWDLPFQQTTWSAVHGPLMISGFLGTVISLERSVALGRAWGYGAPLLSALGSAALVVGLPDPAGPLLITASSIVLVAIFGVFLARQVEFYLLTMALGALAWLVGNALWDAGWQIPRFIPWWVGFLVLTIVGERLELNRLTRPSGAVLATFALALALFCAGLLASALDLEAGWRVIGFGLLALALWLLRFDIARRTVRRAGLPRFIALGLFAGYLWLVVAALLALTASSFFGGLSYDALLHTILLGFVFSMIFVHAPIIFPALTAIDVPFTRRFYVHLALLHLSLVARIAADQGHWWDLRQWGGLLNAIALLLFLANTALAVLSSRSRAGRMRGMPPPPAGTVNPLH